MYSTPKLSVCALIVAQLLGAVYCGIYDNTDNWVKFNKTLNFPENPVLGGYDRDGYLHFVGRVSYSGSILPARVKSETAYITFNTESVGAQANSVDLLVSNATVNYVWVRSFDGYREKDAVSVGTSSQEERVYVCRASVDDGLFIGTLYLAQQNCIIQYINSPLRKLSKYEVLVRKSAGY